MYIILLCQSCHFILIKLFDNDATIKWFDLASKMKFDKGCFESVHHTLSKENRDIVKYMFSVQTLWNDIKSALKQLTNLGFKIPFEIPDIYNFDQNTLNLLHRFYTYNVIWHHDMNSLENYENPFDPDFKTDYDFDKWHEIIDVINRSVHNLEKFTETVNKVILTTYPLHTIHVFMTQSSSHKNWVGFNLEEQKENYKYRQYLITDKPLVLLDNSILGKSYLQSFLEHDDPTCKDCTGRSGSFGGFHIDLTKNRSKIYNSSKFKKWILDYNIVNPPLEFPIGQVIDYSMDSLEDLHLKEIDFKIDDVIFSKTI